MTSSYIFMHVCRSNIWLGPKGVASPCHYDPFHNMLCQVMGTKRVVLFDPGDTDCLYPANGTSQKNTSLIDVSSPDLNKFPLFANIKSGSETTLEPGDALFIPLKYWHYCESTSGSCSVNFWWL